MTIRGEISRENEWNDPTRRAKSEPRGAKHSNIRKNEVERKKKINIRGSRKGVFSRGERKGDVKKIQGDERTGDREREKSGSAKK